MRSLHEAVSSGHGGEVVLRRGTETGRAFFVGGRIAWITASTIKQTFFSFLSEQTELSDAQLHEVFKSCKKSGANFGEMIVERGLLAEEVLRGLLLRHLAACMFEILTWPDADAMFVPEARAYKGSLTFELSEVLAAVLELDTERRLPFAGRTVEEILADLSFSAAPTAAIPSIADGPARSRRLWPWLAAALVAALAGAVGIYFALRAPPPRPSAPVTITKPALPDASAPSSQPSTSQPSSAPATQPAPPEPVGPIPVIVGLKGEGRGSIHVLSWPRRARIYLDGVDLRRHTPYKLRNVSAGVEHVVQVRKNKYRPAFKRFKLAPHMEAKLRFALRRARALSRTPVAVRLESTPAGATIFVNRRAQEQTTPAEVQLDPRRASLVEVRLAGFRRRRYRLLPIDGVPLTYRIELKPVRAKKKRLPRKRRRPRAR